MVRDRSTNRRQVLGAAALAGLAALGVALPARAAPKHAAIRQAITAMQEAVDELEAGKRIYGGHRAKAVKLLREAIAECKEALEFATKK